VIKENRKSERHRQFLRGFVRLPNNATIDCIVRDISETGAKLRFKSAPPMMELFELHIPSKEQIAKTKLIWSNGYEAGISLVCPGALGYSSFASSEGELPVRVGRLEDEIAALKQMLTRLHKADQTKAA
jgi:hypothetical protein